MDRRLPNGETSPSGLKEKCLAGNAGARVFEAERGLKPTKVSRGGFPQRPALWTRPCGKPPQWTPIEQVRWPSQYLVQYSDGSSIVVKDRSHSVMIQTLSCGATS